jgi:hypothetical protein
MKCVVCGGNLSNKIGDIKVNDPYVGEFIVEKAQYSICENCGDTNYAIETTKIIDSIRNDILRQKIEEFAIGEFIGSKDAADFLGITRQALSKNKRIRRGFIYMVKKGSECTLYLRRSLIQFKETNDGRFPLFQVRDLKALQYTRRPEAISNYPTSPVQQKRNAIDKVASVTKA